MKKPVWIPVALALLLTACAGRPITPEGYGGYIGFFARHPNPNRPNVVIDDDAYVILDQEPIHIKLKQGKSPVIVFRLELGTPYVFADDPITIAPVGASIVLKGLECPVKGTGAALQVLVCTYDDPTVEGKYSFTLRVKNRATGKILTSDPTIVNG